MKCDLRNIEIRSATPQDAEELLAIYSPYVRETAISFEYDVPTVDEFQGRIRKTLQSYPYLVASCEGKIVGYAYAGAFINRAAYDRSAELSIYVDKKSTKSGIGGKLYREIEEELKKMGILNLYACIAYPEPEDEYVTLNSVKFHEYMGFTLAGRFHKCGYKFDRWYDMVWMEKIIGEHD